MDKILEEYKAIINDTILRLDSMDEHCNSEGSFRLAVQRRRDALIKFLKEKEKEEKEKEEKGEK